MNCLWQLLIKVSGVRIPDGSPVKNNYLNLGLSSYFFAFLCLFRAQNDVFSLKKGYFDEILHSNIKICNLTLKA